MSSPFPQNYFDFFTLGRKLNIDADELQKRFYQLSRQWHPDRFSRKSPAEQAQALAASSVLNDGYRTLRDPVKRAEYLLTEEGFPIGEQRSKDVPPELLEEVFELNMMLEELRSAQAARCGTGQKRNSADLAASGVSVVRELPEKSGDMSARNQLASARANFAAMRSDLDEGLAGLFAKYDASPSESETARQALHEIRGVLNRRRYIENLIRDVERALNPQTLTEKELEDRL